MISQLEPDQAKRYGPFIESVYLILILLLLFCKIRPEHRLVADGYPPIEFTSAKEPMSQSSRAVGLRFTAVFTRLAHGNR